MEAATSPALALVPRTSAAGRERAQAEARHIEVGLRNAPKDQFVPESRFRRRLRLDTHSHYPIHTAAIREWREQRPGT